MCRRRNLFIFLILIAPFFLSSSTASARVDLETPDNAWVKLGRGLVNIVSCPWEIVYQMIEMEKSERRPIAAVGGFFKGLAYMPVRLLAGVYEVVTFPIPIPPGYRSVIHPEIVVPEMRR